MNTLPLSIDDAPPATAADAVDRFDLQLRPAALALYEPDEPPLALAARLERHGHLADARRAMACGLPRRHALWWGALCSWEALRPDPALAADAALAAVVRYVRGPGDDARRACYAAARAAGVTSLAGTLGLAAFCAAGSISLPGLPCVPPKPGVAPKLVGVAVYLASVARDPAHYRLRLRHFLAVGREVLAAARPWEDVAAAAAAARTG